MGKKKGKKKGGKKGGKVVDGLSTNEMSSVQLLGHIKRLQAEIDREREERNFFMLEREKLFTLWNLAVEQLSEEKQKARLIEAQMEQGKKETKGEMDLYKQKLRFLQAEQSKKLGLVRLNHLQKMKKVQDDVWAIQLVMRETLEAKKKQLRCAQVSLYELLRRMHLEHSETTSNMRKEFANEIRRVEMTMDRKLMRQRDNAEVQAKQEMARVMQIKDEQLEHMISMHEKQVLDMKAYFHDLMTNNFAVITALQQDVIKKKIQQQRLRRRHKETKQKYLAVLGPIQEMELQMEEWNEQEFDTDRLYKEIRKVNEQLEKNQRYARMIECANEALSQRIAIIKAENVGLKKQVTKEILDAQRKESMKRLMLQLKNRALEDETEVVRAMHETNTMTQNPGSSDVKRGKDFELQEILRRQAEAFPFQDKVDDYECSPRNVCPDKCVGTSI